MKPTIVISLTIILSCVLLCYAYGGSGGNGGSSYDQNMHSNGVYEARQPVGPVQTYKVPHYRAAITGAPGARGTPGFYGVPAQPGYDGTEGQVGYIGSGYVISGAAEAPVGYGGAEGAAGQPGAPGAPGGVLSGDQNVHSNGVYEARQPVGPVQTYKVVHYRAAVGGAPGAPGTPGFYGAPGQPGATGGYDGTEGQVGYIGSRYVISGAAEAPVGYGGAGGAAGQPGAPGAPGGVHSGVGYDLQYVQTSSGASDRQTSTTSTFCVIFSGIWLLKYFC